MDANEEMETALQWAEDASSTEPNNEKLFDAHMADAARWAVIAQAQQLKRIADALESIVSLGQLYAMRDHSMSAGDFRRDQEPTP